eukprot:3039890-Prorocentrum_lima.AAC.1
MVRQREFSQLYIEGHLLAKDADRPLHCEMCRSAIKAVAIGSFFSAQCLACCEGELDRHRGR